MEGVPDRLCYSLPEAGRLLSVSTSTVKRLIASGHLGTVTVGAHRRVPRSALFALLDSPERAREAQG